MNRTRRRRLIIVLLVLCAAGAATALTAIALSRNMNYLLTPSQVRAHEAAGYHTFRLGGMVQAGSIHRSSDSLEVRFTVVDADGSLPVSYTGILPDLFRANQSVIATGHMRGDHFVATEVLAKHDEKYMPRELKQAMAKAHGAHAAPGNGKSGIGNR